MAKKKAASKGVKKPAAKRQPKGGLTEASIAKLNRIIKDLHNRIAALERATGASSPPGTPGDLP